MTSGSQVVCIGDLFVEYLVPGVSPGTTHVVETTQGELGGTAFNICWYLSCLGTPSRLVAPFSRRERPQLTAVAPHVSRSHVLWTSGPSDILIVLSDDIGHKAVYLRADLPTDIGERLERECCSARRVVLAGSRHPAIRRIFVKLVRQRRVERLIFSPSYAVYEFTRRELRELVEGVDLLILNEGEAEFVRDRMGCSTLETLGRRVPGTLIVTLAGRGTNVYEAGSQFVVRSMSGVDSDVIGAGDAFLAGYLHETSRGSPSRGSLYFAAAVAAQVARAGKVRTAVRASTARRLVVASWRQGD